MTFPAIIAAVTPITLPTSTVNSRPTPPLSCACSCNSSSIFTVRNPSNRRSNPIGPIRRIKAAASDSTAIVDNPTVVSTSEEDEIPAKIGARVRVTVPLKVYHVPKVAEVDLNGKEGKVKEYVAVWKAQVGMSGHGGVVDGSTAVKFLQKQQPVAVAVPPPRHPQTAEIGTVPQLLAGGIAGAFSKTCTAPLARLTILFQVQGMHSEGALLSRPCIWNEASRIVNEEGLRAFWKGNLVTIVHRLPYTAVNFYAYEQYKKLLKSIPGIGNNSGTAAADACVHFVGGGMAGITAATATYPLDLIRTRLAAQPMILQRPQNHKLQGKFETWKLRLYSEDELTTWNLQNGIGCSRSTIYYNGIWHALRTISRDEGVFGMYKGLGATLLGVGPSIAISFSVYETLRSYWKSHRPNDSTVMVSLTCGSLSGIASSTATFPLDLVRRRKQLEGVGGRARVYNSGLLGTLRHIMRTEGLRGLYRGILPEYYKVVPGVGIVFMTYETLKKLLSEPPSF